MANTGIGRLDPEGKLSIIIIIIIITESYCTVTNTREKLASAERFYSELGTLARDKRLESKNCKAMYRD